MLISGLGLLALPALAGAGVPATQIGIRDNAFVPKKPPARNLQPGPSFHWSSLPTSTLPHNVRQDVRLFRSGDLTSGAIDYTIRASAGSFHYYCELHRDLGMTGVVKVRPVIEPDDRQGEVRVLWADGSTDTGSRFDVRYRVDHRKWKTWKNDTKKFAGKFGRNDHPVNFRPNRHTYKVKVRSEKRRVKKHSDWSPKLTLKP